MDRGRNSSNNMKGTRARARLTQIRNLHDGASDVALESACPAGTTGLRATLSGAGVLVNHPQLCTCCTDATGPRCVVGPRGCVNKHGAASRQPCTTRVATSAHHMTSRFGDICPMRAHREGVARRHERALPPKVLSRETRMLCLVGV